MQTAFDFSGLKQQLGPTYDAFCEEWLSLHKLLAGRGHAIIPAGRIISGMVERYGEQLVRQAVQLSKAPGWSRAQALLMAYEWLRDMTLTDDQAAVLDSIIYTRMSKAVRQQALQWMKDGRSTQEIDDLLDSVRSLPFEKTAPAPTVTEDDVRRHYCRMLEREGWKTDTEQPTDDGGAVDIVAHKGNDMLIVECKVDLTRTSAIEALGQLTLYSQTYFGARWQIGYWNLESSAEAVVKACANIAPARRPPDTSKQAA